jgi:glucans biosynthesis protein C
LDDATAYVEKNWGPPAWRVVDALTVVIVIGWLFALGLFFLIAGRLSGQSLDRDGPGRFGRERLIRLGTPVLAYTRLVSPALEYFDYRGNEAAGAASGRSLRIRSGISGPGPDLVPGGALTFSLGYALLRALRPPTRAPSRAPLRGRHVAGIVIAIAISSFAFSIGSEQFHL